MAARKAHILDLPNELLEKICRELLVLRHLQDLWDPKIAPKTIWRHETNDHSDNANGNDSSDELTTGIDTAFTPPIPLWEGGQDLHTWTPWDTANVADDIFSDQKSHQAVKGVAGVPKNTKQKADHQLPKPSRTEHAFPERLIDCECEEVDPEHDKEYVHEQDEDGCPLYYGLFDDFIVKPRSWNCLAIARTCTRLRDVAMRVYYRENLFDFTDTAAMKLFARHLRRVGRSGADIRYLRLKLGHHSLMQDRRETIFFSPIKSSRDLKSPFVCMFPNVEYLEIDFNSVRDEWQFGGKGTVSFIDALRKHVRVPYADITDISYIPVYHRLLEMEIMELERFEANLSEFIYLENLFGPEPADMFLRSRLGWQRKCCRQNYLHDLLGREI